jgi:hypothetical protein
MLRSHFFNERAVVAKREWPGRTARWARSLSRPTF